jgi:glutamine phosphoribosylpyrophosphate amidotransferase
MCSIIGFQGVYETDLITRLCYNSRIRGLHSFGFSFYQNGKLQVKKYLNYDKFLTDLNKHKPNKFIAHFRYSTSGDYKKIENNQPLIYEDQSIIFNGVISQKSKDEMQEEFQLKLTAENDGFVLVQKYDDLEFIKNRNISFAMIALSDNKLIALRNNNRPLHCYQDKKKTVFASTKDILIRSGLLQSTELTPLQKMII